MLNSLLPALALAAATSPVWKLVVYDVSDDKIWQAGVARAYEEARTSWTALTGLPFEMDGRQCILLDLQYPGHSREDLRKAVAEMLPADCKGRARFNVGDARPRDERPAGEGGEYSAEQMQRGRLEALRMDARRQFAGAALKRLRPSGLPAWLRSAVENHIGWTGWLSGDWARSLHQQGGYGAKSPIPRGPASAAKVAATDGGNSPWADLMLEFVFSKHGSAAVARLLRETKAPEDIAALAMNQPDSQEVRERFDAAFDQFVRAKAGIANVPEAPVGSGKPGAP